MLLSRVLAVVFLLFSSAAFAGSINANMSNTAAQFEAGFSSGGNAEIQTGVFYNDQGSVLLDGGLMVKGGGGEQDVATGVSGGGGIRVVVGQIQQGGVTNIAECIALGGMGSFTPPAFPLVAVVGEVFNSLKITSYGDANHFSEFAVRIEMGPPHAKFYVGYRETTFSIIGTGSVTINNGSYMGIVFTF
jgi:hypothetical protein